MTGSAQRLRQTVVVRLRCLAVLGISIGGAACGDNDPLGGGDLGSPGPGNQSLNSYRRAFAGTSHGCALVNGGGALCWGVGGALGDGTEESSEIPVRVQGAQIFAKLDLSSHTCGITTGLTGGQAWCWGPNVDGVLGDGSLEARDLPTAVKTPLFFTDITTGAAHGIGADRGDPG